jgi:filamentous hemagglutinin
VIDSIKSDEVGPIDSQRMQSKYQALLKIQGRYEEAGFIYEKDWATTQRMMLVGLPVSELGLAGLGKLGGVVKGLQGGAGKVGQADVGSANKIGNVEGAAGDVPAPKVSANSQGMTEVVPSATPLNRQRELNTADISGNGKLKPAEASAAAQIEPAMGHLQRYDGPPTVGKKAPDFQITEGPNAGKTVDLMYTTAGNSAKEIAGLNKFFEKNMTVPEGPGLPPKGVGQIQEHFNKADVVVMDLRTLTPTNQKILMDYVITLSPAQQGKIVIIK